MMADVLTFYQERIANENYLRTATQRNSIVQLADLIGYQPSPGVAASVALAFTLQSAPGSPTQATQPSPVPVGTREQSVPDPGQSAQTFETIGAITARVEWNAIPAQINVAYGPAQGLSDLYLTGTATQLNPGDAIVIVGGERTPPGSASSRWDVRWLETVTTDTTNNLTHITWAPPLGAIWATPSAHGAQVFALRQRASLFGANAPDPRLMNVTNHHLVNHDGTWRHYHIDTTGQAVDLDAAYPKIVQGSWVVLANAVSGAVELYNVSAVTQLSRTAFGLSGKITRLSFDIDTDLGSFTLPETQVLAQSGLLALAPRRLPYPVFGSTLTLGVADGNIVPGQLLGVNGKLQRVAIGSDTTGITFADDPTRGPAAGDSFLMLGSQRSERHGDGARRLLAVAGGAGGRSGGQRGRCNRRWRRRHRAGPRHHDPVADRAAGELLRPVDRRGERQRRAGHSGPSDNRNRRQRRRQPAEPELHTEAVAADLGAGSERSERPVVDSDGFGERPQMVRGADALWRRSHGPHLRSRSGE
jgi:hypothetical protein